MSLVVLPQVAPPRRLVTPRLIATLALFVVSAMLFCTVVGYVLVHRADDQQAQERRGRWVKLPYGIPLCVGFLMFLLYRLVLVA